MGLTPASAIQYFLIALVIGVLSLTSYYDIKYREVDTYIWYLSIKIGFVLSFTSFYFLYPIRVLLFYYLISLLSIIGIAIAYLTGHIGGGDLWASAFIALSLPINPLGGILPPIILILLIGALLELSTRTFMNISACRKANIFNKRCLSSSPIKAYDLIKENKYKWYFAVSTSKDISCDDPHETVLMESKGDFNKIIWAEPGLPFLVFILISIPVGLLLGMMI
ncbi:MAG: hypothetical protein F7B61_03015 [Caldisphaeraceae archaeon]|nr:hypothetical protein [Caldisphaeraceae archaeon]